MGKGKHNIWHVTLDIMLYESIMHHWSLGGVSDWRVFMAALFFLSFLLVLMTLSSL